MTAKFSGKLHAQMQETRTQLIHEKEACARQQVELRDRELQLAKQIEVINKFLAEFSDKFTATATPDKPASSRLSGATARLREIYKAAYPNSVPTAEIRRVLMDEGIAFKDGVQFTMLKRGEIERVGSGEYRLIVHGQHAGA